MDWVFIGSVEGWFEKLNSDEPGLGALQVISRFESLGVLYLSNYYYFVAKIMRLVDRGEAGTAIAYERLVRQFEDQATGPELEGSRSLAVLRRVLGSFPNSFIKSPNDRVNLPFIAKHEDLLDEAIEAAAKEHGPGGKTSKGGSNV
jgi:hypothetical protein